MRYQLLCKDDVRAEFDMVEDEMFIVKDIDVFGTLPVGCSKRNFMSWLECRKTTKYHKKLGDYLMRMYHRGVTGLIEVSHGVSMNDCFWIRRANEPITWYQVSPYTNDFDDNLSKVAITGCPYYEEPTSRSLPDFTNRGTYDMCWRRSKFGNIYLYKAGTENGLEPYCEVLASQVYSKMNAGILYNLVNRYGRDLSVCKAFTSEYVSYVPHILEHNDVIGPSSMLAVYDNMPTGNIFRRMLVCDAITFNTDRSLDSFGILINSESNHTISMAPAFDFNQTLFTNTTVDELKDIDTFVDRIKSGLGDNILNVAKKAMTQEIRDDLVALKGITLELPYYTKYYPQQRVEWMTHIVNMQIDNILANEDPVYPPLKINGLSNCMKYRMKFRMSNMEWEAKVPYLCKLLDVANEEELEEAITVFLN